MAHYLPILSSFILVFSFLPLLNKIRKNRSVSGLSLLMMAFGVAQSVYFITYNLYFERFYMVLPFVGLIMSSVRVMPQTYKTLRSGDISNLSSRYFSLQFIAGVCGLFAELAMAAPSTSHVLTFVMILLTNAAQLGCIQYYKMRPVAA
ncbi:PQ-loop repeat-containing protein [Pseudoalteromonas sp. SG41-1]|uniref:PQ-loop repeat-containing protein n=1 Tax=Pseudoalteromonas sp. SG41-1 TaxID=2760979 RepID=UPI0016004610|nr:PQ-loop repeat-containing protein [Pseudoalteromonas sp. SG41-1]MBB1504824.1 PQ-loop repeat-containing protein [Pseudoalteromonas sp. SG41-1]